MINNTNSNNQVGFNGLYYVFMKGSTIADTGYIHRDIGEGMWVVSDIESNGDIDEYQCTIDANIHLRCKYFTNVGAMKLFIELVEQRKKEKEAQAKATTNSDWLEPL